MLIIINFVFRKSLALLSLIYLQPTYTIDRYYCNDLNFLIEFNNHIY